MTGHKVVMFDISSPMLSRAESGISKSLARVAKKVAPDSPSQFVDQAMSNISTTSDLATSVGQAELVVEAVVENLALKQKLFVDLENFSPDGALLASNTSSLPITAIARDLKRPEFFGGLHFFNPVPMMKPGFEFSLD